MERRKKYDLLKEELCKKNGIIFHYLKHYDFKKGNSVVNSILNKDLMDLHRNKIVKLDGEENIELTQYGQELVDYFKRKYPKLRDKFIYIPTFPSDPPSL